MRKRNRNSILLFLLLLCLPITLGAQYINVQGQEVFLRGINLPWNNFGWDFGEHPSWGSGFELNFYRTAFEEFQDSEVDFVRIWIHCDGRATPNFDNTGSVTGLDDGFLHQLTEILDLAEDFNLKVLYVLWSHDMFEDNTSHAGSFAGLHSDLIIDSNKTDSYIRNALTPIVQEVADHCALLAWEIINEPEWAIEGTRGTLTKQTVEKEDIQRFVGQCIETIREHSDQKITIGSAVPFGNFDTKVKNYWSEAEFQKQGFNCEHVNLDFYSFHYFGWMDDDLNPFLQNIEEWQLLKPVLISESEFNSFTQDITTISDEYAGMAYWSYKSDDGLECWDECRTQIENYNGAGLMEQSCDESTRTLPNLLCHISPNPASNILKVSYDIDEFDIRYSIYHFSGQFIGSGLLDKEEKETRINIASYFPGSYFIHFTTTADNNQLLRLRTESFNKY